jgi:hypothetical protein
MLNVLQRVGGSLGVAVFTVILQNSIREAHSRGGITTAFAHTYRWVVAAALLALLPALILLREEARARRERGDAQRPKPQPLAA